MPDVPLVRRRAVLGAGLAGAAALTGCDSGEDLVPPEAGGSSTPTAEATGASQAPEQSPDQALVDEVAGSLVVAVELLLGARRFPPLRAAVVPLLRAHRRHLAVLESDAEAAPLEPPADRATALRDLLAGERSLRLLLVDGAGRAESGALARLLASMAASVSQHLTLLPAQEG